MERVRGKVLGAIILLLAIIVFLIGYLVFREKQFVQVAQSQYNQSFYELIAYAENVETLLSKTLISNSREYTAENLVNVWREANLAQNSISNIPINVNNLEDINNYFNQVSDYAYAMSKICINGECLSDKQKSELKEISQYSSKLKEQLMSAVNDMQSGAFSWNDMTRTGNRMFNQNYDAVQVDFVDNINNDLQNYAGLIYDGAFSNHILQLQPKGLRNEQYTEEMAKEKIKEYFDESKVENIISNGLNEEKIATYDFDIKLKDDDSYALISITQKGGHLLYLTYSREYEAVTIDVNEAKKIGKEYLERIGYENMEPTYHMNDGNGVVINYAYSENGVIAYPDLIKVKVGLDKADILGLEANGYLYNHYNRNIAGDVISVDQARESVNSNLQIETEKLVVIPTDWKSEILCYEFKGKINEKDVLVYINANTGKEENILIILDDSNGMLTI